MLAILITMLMLGGGATTSLLYDPGELKEQVKEWVIDDTDRSEALETIKAIEKRNEAHVNLVKSTSKLLDESLGNNAFTDAELDAIWVDYMKGVTTYHRDYIDLRFQLKEHISRDEWEAIFSSSADEV